MKKIFIFLISFLFIITSALSAFVFADPVEPETIDTSMHLKIGDYFTLGKYNDRPIVWRYVADDEQGKLVVSDKILCYKPFGDDYSDEGKYIGCALWKDSFIREWLNSTISTDKADWSPVIDEFDEQYYNMEINEKGFLHEDNFSAEEKFVLKPVTQWTMLSKYHLDLSENGIDTVYDPVKLHVPGSPKDGGITEFYDIPELPEHYFGAAYQTIDTIFLLDEMQLYNMWKNIDDIRTTWDKEFDFESYSPYYHYFLRTPFGVSVCCVNGGINPDILNNNAHYDASIDGKSGVRPAFYINEDNAAILSGSGTADEPYVITGKETTNGGNGTDDPEQLEKPSGISVFYNGSKISFDQSPFIENDRVLVPMRAIFEAFEAEVEWNNAEQSITAVRGTDIIKMQIGNTEIIKNGIVTQSEVAPKLVGDRTFVPLRVISESLNAKVDWSETEREVIITK